MSTHNIGFYEETTKIIFQLSPNIIKYAPYLFFCSESFYGITLHYGLRTCLNDSSNIFGVENKGLSQCMYVKKKVILLTPFFGNLHFAYHVVLNHPLTNMILSSFCIQKVVKCASKILKISQQIKI